jgi:hypothetical protein
MAGDMCLHLGPIQKEKLNLIWNLQEISRKWIYDGVYGRENKMNKEPA